MNRHALTILLLCGAFATSGVALPFVLGPDPAYVSTINALHGLSGLGFFGALLSLFGIAGASASSEE